MESANTIGGQTQLIQIAIGHDDEIKIQKLIASKLLWGENVKANSFPKHVISSQSPVWVLNR